MKIARQLFPKKEIWVLQQSKKSKPSRFADGIFYQPDTAVNSTPHAAIVANPASLHLGISFRLASNGCHLLVEKPISTRSQGVKKLLQEIKKQKVVLQVGYNLRFSQSLQKFKKLISKGIVGRILSIHAEVGKFLPFWRAGVDYRQTVSARADLGGGVLLELSHEIDYLRWIFGKVIWVSAWLDKIGDLKVNVEDSAKIQMGFVNEKNKLSLVATLNMDFLRQDSTRFCQAIGTKGTLRWDGVKNEVHRYFPKKRKWIKIFKSKQKTGDSYMAQLKSFLQCVTQGNKPKVTGADGLAVLKIIEAAKLSHRKNGQRVLIRPKGL